MAVWADSIALIDVFIVILPAREVNRAGPGISTSANTAVPIHPGAV